MKMREMIVIATALILGTCFAVLANAQEPKMKYSTEIPANVVTPDRTETRLGALEFVDGFPTEATAEKVWDHMDFSRAVESMIMTTPAASLQGFRKGIQKWGPDNETMIYWGGRLDSKGLLLTGNTTVVYTFMWIDLKDGPMVMETPPNVLGIIDDAWFHYVCDFGNAGDDKGKGGKFLLVPPGYKGELPTDGYFVKKSKTYGHWLAMRGFMTDFDPVPVVKNMKEHFRLYPLGSEPKEVNWVNTAMKDFNTLHAQDATFFDEVNITVQEEPNSAEDPEILGLLASIGIQKGKPFKPDARMKKILAEAAAVGTAAQRTILFRNRDTEHRDLAGQQKLGARLRWWQPRVSQRRRQSDQFACPLPLLRHRHHARDGQTTCRSGIAVCDRSARCRGQCTRRQQDLSNPHSAERSGQTILGHHRLRQPDPLAVANRQSLPGRHQYRQGHRPERGRILRRLHRPEEA